MLEFPLKARLGAVAVVTLLGLSAVSGCARITGTQPRQGSADATGSRPAAAGAQPTLPAPSSIANDLGKRKRVSITACEAAAGGWQAQGTATGSSGKPESYKVVVYFTSPSATVLAYGETTVDVQPGKGGTWQVRQTFAAPKGTLCVLRAVS